MVKFQPSKLAMRVRFPLPAIPRATVEALTAHDFGHFRCGLRARCNVGRHLRRKENFACVGILYRRSRRKTEDLDVTGIRRERTGNQAWFTGDRSSIR
jgi:hypothetical protein